MYLYSVSESERELHGIRLLVSSLCQSVCQSGQSSSIVVVVTGVSITIIGVVVMIITEREKIEILY